MTMNNKDYKSVTDWLKVVIEHRQYVRDLKPLPDDDAYFTIDTIQSKIILEALKTLEEIEELLNPTPLNEGMERDIIADIKRMAAHLGRAEAKNIIYREEIKRKDIALQNRNIRIRQLVQIITDKNKLIRNFRLKII